MYCDDAVVFFRRTPFMYKALSSLKHMYSLVAFIYIHVHYTPIFVSD